MSTILPTLNANTDVALVAGYSSGALMSAQLSLAFPEMFNAGAFLNGGMPGINQEDAELLKS